MDQIISLSKLYADKTKMDLFTTSRAAEASGGLQARLCKFFANLAKGEVFAVPCVKRLTYIVWDQYEIPVKDFFFLVHEDGVDSVISIRPSLVAHYSNKLRDRMFGDVKERAFFPIRAASVKTVADLKDWLEKGHLPCHADLFPREDDDPNNISEPSKVRQVVARYADLIVLADHLEMKELLGDIAILLFLMQGAAIREFLPYIDQICACSIDEQVREVLAFAFATRVPSEILTSGEFAEAFARLNFKFLERVAVYGKSSDGPDA